MTMDEASSLLHARPFVPLRIHITDGKSFEVRHPEFVWVLRHRLDIAILSDAAKGVVDHVERCFFQHFVRVEELESRAEP